jgi:hypothetical protein
MPPTSELDTSRDSYGHPLPHEVMEEALFEAKRVLVGQDRMLEVMA